MRLFTVSSSSPGCDILLFCSDILIHISILFCDLFHFLLVGMNYTMRPIVFQNFRLQKLKTLLCFSLERIQIIFFGYLLITRCKVFIFSKRHIVNNFHNALPFRFKSFSSFRAMNNTVNTFKVIKVNNFPIFATFTKNCSNRRIHRLKISFNCAMRFLLYSISFSSLTINSRAEADRISLSFTVEPTKQDG